MEGNWIDNKMNGIGKMTYNNGDYYEGEWKENLKDGKGIFIN